MSLQKWLNGSVYRLFSISLSNMEGPRQRVCWAGYEVEDFFTLSYGPMDMVSANFCVWLYRVLPFILSC